MWRLRLVHWLHDGLLLVVLLHGWPRHQRTGRYGRWHRALHGLRCRHTRAHTRIAGLSRPSPQRRWPMPSTPHRLLLLAEAGMRWRSRWLLAAVEVWRRRRLWEPAWRRSGTPCSIWLPACLSIC